MANQIGQSAENRPIQGVPAGAMKDAIVAPETESTGLQDLRGIPLNRRKASRAMVRTGRSPLGIQRPTYTREEDCLRSKDNARTYVSLDGLEEQYKRGAFLRYLGTILASTE